MYIAFNLGQVKIQSHYGIAVVNKPAYEFEIQAGDNLKEKVSIKIKLKSNYNPNYIKLIGMVNIEM